MHFEWRRRAQVKEALFSILREFDVLREDAVALDTFAGCGSVGIEALSQVVCVSCNTPVALSRRPLVRFCLVCFRALPVLKRGSEPRDVTAKPRSRRASARRCLWITATRRARPSRPTSSIAASRTAAWCGAAARLSRNEERRAAPYGARANGHVSRSRG